MHARAIYNMLTQGQLVQKCGSNLHPPENHILIMITASYTVVTFFRMSAVIQDGLETCQNNDKAKKWH